MQWLIVTAILVCLEALAEPLAKDGLEFKPAPGLKAVDVLQREATFVAKDMDLRFLDVTVPGEPKPVFRLNSDGDLNVGIALAKDSQHVVVTDGKRIYRVNEKGDTELVATLGELKRRGSKKEHIHGSILWFFASSNMGDDIFFVLFSGAQASVCKLELESKELELIDFPFPAGIDVDFDAGIVYGPDEPPTQKIIAKSFDGKIERSLPTSNSYYFCRLSPDKGQLLLSDVDLEGQPPIALMDLTTGHEKVLSIRGHLAAWASDNTVFFLRGSNSLWRYRIGDDQPAEVLTVRGQRAMGYAIAPLLSVDKTLLAWGWSCQTEEGFKNGTVLIDLQNNEYRALKGRWNNVQWLQK